MSDFSNYCGEIGAVCEDLAEKAARIAKLEAERDRLRKALKEIAKFADSEYEKRIPAPSCVEFLTINQYAEKALKGAEQEVE